MPKKVVLNESESIYFENNNGSGRISYEGPSKRSFEFGELENPVTLDMIVREKEFRGLLGIYNPGQRFFGSKQRIVSVESEIYFSSSEEAEKRLVQGRKLNKWVMNSDGYVVGYFESPNRDQINISLFRFFVNGEPYYSPAYSDGTVELIKK